MKKWNGFLSVRGAVSLACVFVFILWAAAQYSGESPRQVSGPEDLRSELRRAQLLSPPSDSAVLYEAGSFVRVPGTGGLAREFVDGLVSRLEPDGTEAWPVTVYEDPGSGDTVVLNADGAVACRLPAEKGADPLWTVRFLFQGWPASHAAGRHAPSRVLMSAKLVEQGAATNSWSGGSGHRPASAPKGYKNYLVVWNSSSNVWLGGESGKAAGVASIDAGYSHCVALHDDGSVTRIGIDPESSAVTERRFESAGAMMASAGALGDTLVLGFDGALRHVSDCGELLGIREGCGNISGIVSGTGFFLALGNGGRLLSWGADGALAPPPGLTGIAEIDAGDSFGVALRHNGEVAAWGDPRLATNIASGVTAVSASRRGSHCLALFRDGKVAAWGDDGFGQCRAPEGLAGVSAVAAGGYHSLALKRDGTVACWGVLKGAPPLLTNVVAICASYLDACAVTDDGTVAVWGKGCPLGGVRLKAKTSGVCEIVDARIADCGLYMAVVRAREGLLEGDADGDGVAGVEEVFLLGSDPLAKDAGAYAFKSAGAGKAAQAPKAAVKPMSVKKAVKPAFALKTVGTTYYVDDANGDDGNSGLSWEYPKHTIQAAVDLAQAGDTVVVTNGVYGEGSRVTPGGLFNNRLVITNGVLVKSVNGAGATVIQGSGAEYFDTWDAVRCVFVTDGVLDGFTLQGGAAVAHWTSSEQRDKSGGCLNMGYASAESEARNCIIAGGTAYDGGGVWGGRLVNCLIRNCNAYYPAGADWSALLNCTVTANGGWGSCGGARSCGVTNSVVFGNTGWESPECHCCTVSFSCSDGSNYGAGNVSDNVLFADPLFSDAGNFDFSLQSDSPCVDAGSNGSVTDSPDILGNMRIQGRAVDMGAFESAYWSGGGPVLTVNGGTGGGTLMVGATAMVSAETPQYYYFSCWSVSPEGTDLGAGFNLSSSSTYVTMPACDVTLTAIYEPLDSDADGFTDALEISVGLNPYSFDDGWADPDGDGLTTYDEVGYLNTRPLLWDTDNDNLDDGQEWVLAAWGFDPLIPAPRDWSATASNGDYDGDGLSNESECSIRTSMVIEDTDGDGFDDGWEVEQSGFGFDPLNPDDRFDDCDGDGLSNWWEVEHQLNPLAAEPDLDCDRLPDAWEMNWFGCTNRADSAGADADGDGVPNSVELALDTDPSFWAGMVTAAIGRHMVSWTPLSGVTNYSVSIRCGEAEPSLYSAGSCSLFVTGDFSTATHQVEVSAFDPALGEERVAVAEFRQPSRPNLTVWKVADAFEYCMRRPLEGECFVKKVIPVRQSSDWPVFFSLTANDSGGTGCFTGYHLYVQTHTDVGPTNEVLLRGEGNLPITVEPGATSLTVSLIWREEDMGPEMPVALPHPVYLSAWTPSVSFGTGQFAGESAGRRFLMNLSTNESGTAQTFTYSVNYDGFMDGDLGSSTFSGKYLNPFPNLPGAISGSCWFNEQGFAVGGALTAGEQGAFDIGAQAAGETWPCSLGAGFTVLNFQVDIERQIERTVYGTSCQDYCKGVTAETGCLRDKLANGDAEGPGSWWEETEKAVEADIPGAPEWLRLSSSCHVWKPGETNFAFGVLVNGTNVCDYGVDRGAGTSSDPSSQEQACDCGSSVFSDCGGSCGDSADSPDSCADGACSSGGPNEGPYLASVNFRIPFGAVGYEAIAGMLSFSAKDDSVSLGANLFSVISNSSAVVACDGAGGVTNISCDAEGVNRIALTYFTRGMTNGIALQVWDSTVRDDGDMARVWEITDEGLRQADLRTKTLRFRKLVGAAVEWDSVFKNENGMWCQTDLITGVADSVGRSGDIETQGYEVTTRRVLHISNPTRVLSERVVRRERFGDAYRDTVVRERVGCTEAWRTTTNAYWVALDNPALNGSPKFRRSDYNGDWEYRTYDDRGRETLRAEPLNGSDAPPFATSDVPATLASFTGAAGLTADVTVTSYENADAESYLDVGKPRKVERYRVTAGLAAKISCEWHTYTREASSEGYGTLRRRVVRACSRNAAKSSPENAWTETLEYDGDSRNRPDTPPALLRGRVIEETRFIGGVKAVTRHEYELTGQPLNRCFVTTVRGTEALPDGTSGKSTYEVSELDAFTGRELRRETRLRTGAAIDPVIAWEERDYDRKGRLVAARYSDGTCESNLWNCCSLDARIGRDGSRTEYARLRLLSEYRLMSETSAGRLPGAGGKYPAVETLSDALGRVTNSVRRVMNADSSFDAAFAPLLTRTEYPSGTSDYRIDVDPLGAETSVSRSYSPGTETEETVSAGVTTRVTRVTGGSTVTERFWDGKWTRETMSESFDSEGCRTATVTSEASDMDGPVISSQTRFDFLGRTVSETNASGVTGYMYLGASDSPWKVTRTGGPDMLYVYDELGEARDTVLDADADGIADYAEADRVTRVETGYGESGGTWWRVDTTRVWDREGTNTALQVSGVHRQMTGLGLPASGVSGVPDGALLTARTVTVDWRGKSTGEATYVDPAEARIWKVKDAPYSDHGAVSASVCGRPVSVVTATGVSTTFAYDGFGRRVMATDGRGNTTVTHYSVPGQVDYTEDAASNRTAYAYDCLGRRTAVADALGGVAHTAYDSLGNVVATWGASYPVAFGYDTAGRMTAMATTRDPALGTTNLLSLLPDGVSLTAYSLQPAPSLDVTRWLYDQATGLLTNKVYADGNGTAYAYTQAGRLSERRWSRGVTAAYGYDSFGQLASIAYSDGTPDVAYAYDRLGRMIFAVSGGSTNAFAYSGLARVAETQGMAALTRAYDQFGRPGAIGINNTCPFSDWVWYASHDFAVNYSYDGSGRLSGAAANCPLDDQWGNYAAFKMSYAFGTGSDLIVETGCEFDENFGCDVAPVSRKIAYEPLRGLVSGVTNTWDGAAVRSYAYDNDALGRRVARTDTAGQVVTANAFGYNLRSEVTNAAMGGTTYSYAYDPIGNRQWAAAGGALTEYASNPLNQYTGLQSTAYSLQPSYDADGNMTAYGPWTYTWDGENRMSSACSNGVLLVTNVYDHMSRRIRKEVSAYNASTGNFEPVTCNSFLWDGWNVVREIHSSNIPAFQCSTNYYTWGLDLSGTLQGAGGVGGLLAVTRVGPESQQPQVFYPCYDANGNVTAYLDSTGTAVGTFEYDAFGNTVAETVSGGLHLPFLFSTKYWDAETGLVMYQLRAYSPELGRWVSRDPIGEKGGVNLYVLIRNNSVNNIDQLGLNSFSDRFEPIIDNYDRLKIKLINELRNECPSEPTERVTGSGNKVCCRPSDCMSEASAIAEAYTDALREANFDRKVPAGGYWGNVLIGIYSGSFGGTYPDDLCPGLMCGGWQDLAEKTAGRVAENSKCWDFRTLYSRNGIGRFLNFDTHTWGELNSINGSVPLDPWPSGGVTY